MFLSLVWIRGRDEAGVSSSCRKCTGVESRQKDIACFVHVAKHKRTMRGEKIVVGVVDFNG